MDPAADEAPRGNGGVDRRDSGREHLGGRVGNNAFQTPDLLGDAVETPQWTRGEGH